MIGIHAEGESCTGFERIGWSGLRFCGLILFLWLALGTGLWAKNGEIHKAVANGDLNKVVALLNSHPELVESRNSMGLTPLHVAVMHSQLEIAELLLANGADVNARDPRQKTPLILAMFTYNHDKMVRLLLAKGAGVNLTDGSSMTALAYAAQLGQVEDAKILIANDGNINFAQGTTPLVMAVTGGHREVVRLLLENGAEVNHKVGSRTALWYAEQSDELTHQFSDPKIVELIESYGGHE